MSQRIVVEKRFQIFVSSTFKDLIEERQAVQKAILELDHMPAGMELFPAADESAWQLIKDVIDASDYYVLIIGGRYGSLDETGLSYTEKEYNYAVKSGIPVIALLHSDPDNLPRGKTETDEEAWNKLTEFREKVESKHTCNYWDSAEELKAKVITGVISAIKKQPAVGWVRASLIPSEDTVREVLDLRKKIADLESELNQARTEAPPGTEDLLQGDDTFELSYTFEAYPKDGTYFDRQNYEATILPTWNEIFAGVSPVLISESNERQVRTALVKLFRFVALQDLQESGAELQGITNFQFRDHELDTCLVQLRALGLIKESDKKRSVHDKATYWTLTPYGDRQMVQLRALRRTPVEKRQSGVKPEIVSKGDDDTDT